MKKLLLFYLLLPNLAQSQNAQVLYKLEELDKNVNTRYHETAPLVTSDNQRLYFTVSNHPENTDGTDNTQDIWFSEKMANGSWGKAQHMGSPLNKRKFNQVLSILDSGNTLLIRGGKNKNKEGFSLTFKEGDSWSKPEALDIKDFENMNKGRFSGAVMSEDRSVIIIYMSERTGKPYSDLYISKLQEDGSYSKPLMIESLSTHQDEFGQYLTNNDKVMYFASNRAGGLGDVDIWKTERLDESWQNWSEPENIGAPINTSGFDSYFSIDASGKNAFTTRTYVSADGSNMNIYALVPKPKITVEGIITDSKTNQPVELTLEIKQEEKDPMKVRSTASGKYSFTTYEETLFKFLANKSSYLTLEDAVDLSKITSDTLIIKNLQIDPIQAEIFLYGYILEEQSEFPITTTIKATQKKWENKVQTNYGDGSYRMQLNEAGPYVLNINDTLYQSVSDSLFISLDDGEYYKEVRKDFTLKKKQRPYVVSGYTFDKKTKAPIKAELTMNISDSTVAEIKSDKDGFYSVNLERASTYKIHASKVNYLNLEESVNIFDNQDFLYYNKDLYLDPIEVGVTVIIKNIYFNFDKTDLKAESFPELNRLTALLKTNSGITIEIAGHTDDKGSDQYNQDLSSGRANAVMNYLLNEGIKSERMIAKGYGETEPISTNYTDEGRAENRRVVFTILSK